MIQANVSPLQLHKLRNLPTGMTESSHLSNAYLTEPERLDAVLAYAFGTQNENVLSMLTGGIGNTRYVSNRQYRWMLHGQNERSIEVTGDPLDATTTPGLNNSVFRIRLAERFFELSDNLVSDDFTHVRVQQDPYQDGLDYVYTLQLVDPDSTLFIDPTQIAKGARFSKLYSTVEEFSNRGGGTNFAAPMELENQLTTLRKNYSVTRSAATDVMVVELFSEDNKSTKIWTKLAEWTALAQWYKEKDKAMIYSKFNKNAEGEVVLQGANKRPVYSGAGIREQIAPANRYYYSSLTYDFLDQVLLDLSYNAKRWGGDHKFLALTGKMGMREFSNAITTKFRSLGVVTTNEGRFIDGSGNELVFKGDQFITANFPNGTSLTVKEFAPYDDIVHNRTLHPKSGKPIESYRFTILNFGQKNGKSNIRKVAKKDSDNAMWYVCGSTTPFGEVSKSISTMRSNGLDGYEVHMLTEEGVQMEDPTSCAELIFSLSA